MRKREKQEPEIDKSTANTADSEIEKRRGKVRRIERSREREQTVSLLGRANTAEEREEERDAGSSS